MQHINLTKNLYSEWSVPECCNQLVHGTYTEYKQIYKSITKRGILKRQETLHQRYKMVSQKWALVMQTGNPSTWEAKRRILSSRQVWAPKMGVGGGASILLVIRGIETKITLHIS
jgi:hypothetical protein